MKSILVDFITHKKANMYRTKFTDDVSKRKMRCFQYCQVSSRRVLDNLLSNVVLAKVRSLNNPTPHEKMVKYMHAFCLSYIHILHFINLYVDNLGKKN